jgi:hypothetical protein
MRFGTWSVRSLYRSGALRAVVRELDLVAVQEVRWEKEGTVKAGIITFLWKRKRIIINWYRIFLPQNRVSS